ERREDLLGRERGGERKVAAADPLRDAQEIGRDAGVLAGEEPPRPPEPGRDLVGDEQRAVPAREAVERTEGRGRAGPHPRRPPAAPGRSGSPTTAASVGPSAASVRSASSIAAVSAASGSIPRCQRKTCGGVRRTAGATAGASQRWNVSEKPTPTAPSVSPW